jgi:hypothetical protein
VDQQREGCAVSETIRNAADPNAPIVKNEKGGGQSHIPVRFDLIDAKALFEVAAVLHEGAEKYGADNWRLIDTDDHLNHLLTHVYAYLSGDRSDDHLSHAVCRAIFALAVEIEVDECIDEPIKDDQNPFGITPGSVWTCIHNAEAAVTIQNVVFENEWVVYHNYGCMTLTVLLNNYFLTEA